MENEGDKSKRVEYKLLLQILYSSQILQLSSHITGIPGHGQMELEISQKEIHEWLHVFNITCSIEKAQP